MAKGKINIDKIVKAFIYTFAGIGLLDFVVGAFNNFNSLFTSTIAGWLLIIVVITWLMLNISVRWLRPSISISPGEQGVGKESRIKWIGVKYQYGFAGIVICLFAFWFFGKKELLFDKKNPALKVIVLPFRRDIKSRQTDMDYIIQLKEHLATIKKSDQYHFELLYPAIDSAHLPVSDEEAMETGERCNADMVIWGSAEEEDYQPAGLRIRYVLTRNYQRIIDSSKRSGDTDMQGLATLSQLRKGYLLKDVDYILNWTEGIAAYQVYDFNRATRFFERAKKFNDAELYSARINSLLANLYMELGKDSIANNYCLQALKSQQVHGDTSSPFYANLLISYGATLSRGPNRDSALYFIGKGIAGLENNPVKDSSNLGIGYLEKGSIYFDSFNPDIALQNYRKALAYLDEKKRINASTLIVLYYNIGIVHVASQRLDSGYYYLNRAFAFQSYLPHPDIIMNSFIFTAFGNLYSQKGSLDTALQYYRKAAHIFTTLLNNKFRLSALYTNIGNLFTNNGKLDSAQRYMLHAKTLMNTIHDTLSEVYVNIIINLGEIYKQRKVFDTAVQMQFEAEKILRKITQNSNYGTFAVIYINIADNSVELSDTKTADVYLKKALVVLKNTTLKMNPNDQLMGYYYWTKAKCEKARGAIASAQTSSDKAIQILSNYFSNDYKDMIELKLFRSSLNMSL